MKLDAGNQPRKSRRTGVWIRLRPISAQDYEFLYQLGVDEEIGYRWRLGGTVPSREAFMEQLWRGVLCQFVIEDLRTGNSIGTVVCYAADLHHRHATIAAATVGAEHRSGKMIEAIDLFIDYLLNTYSLDKIYLEVIEFNLIQFSSTIDWVFGVEGVLKGHSYFDGQSWDKYILAVNRETFYSLPRGRDGHLSLIDVSLASWEAGSVLGFDEFRRLIEVELSGQKMDLKFSTISDERDDRLELDSLGHLLIISTIEDIAGSRDTVSEDMPRIASMQDAYDYYRQLIDTD